MPSELDKHPPEIESFAEGVSALTVCKQPAIKDTMYLTYYTPDPNFILGTGEENKALYITAWIVTQNAHMYNVANSIVMEQITKQQWRQFLKSILKHIAPALKTNLELGDDDEDKGPSSASSVQGNVLSSSSSIIHSNQPIASSSQSTHSSRPSHPPPPVPALSGIHSLPPRPQKRRTKPPPLSYAKRRTKPPPLSYAKRHKKSTYRESLPV